MLSNWYETNSYYEVTLYFIAVVKSPFAALIFFSPYVCYIVQVSFFLNVAHKKWNELSCMRFILTLRSTLFKSLLCFCSPKIDRFLKVCGARSLLYQLNSMLFIAKYEKKISMRMFSCSTNSNKEKKNYEHDLKNFTKLFNLVFLFTLFVCYSHQYLVSIRNFA